MPYVFEDYDDNLNERKLAKIPTKQLQELVDNCEGNGGGLCEVCRFYAYVIGKRKK